MGNLLTQSLKILKQAAVEQGKDYMSNTVSLINDAEELRSEVMKSSKNSIDTLKNMKRNFNFRVIHDWFYQKNTEYDEYGGGDDFDAGFDTGAEEDNDSTILDRDAMKKIASNQSSMMLQIGAKQTETTMASTAEIVTTVNQRSSEILSSINNINTTLLGISKKLDAFASVVEAEKTEQAKQSLYDSQGRLSLQSIYQTAKNNGGGLFSDASNYASFLPMIAQGGPAGILQALYSMSGIGEKGLKILGGNSIDSTMDKINTSIGEAVQRGLEDLISSKTFKTLFGDLKRGEANHNYKEDVVKGYNNKQATFDGYVRTTIIKTIPEYLRVIAKGVTGVNYNIGKNGELSQGTRMSSKMNDEQFAAWNKDETANRTQLEQAKWGNIAKDAFKGSSLSWGARDELYQSRSDAKIDRQQMTMIANTLNGVLAELIGNTRSNRLEPKMLIENIDNLTEEAISITARILYASMGNKIDWKTATRTALTAIANGSDARRFCNGVNNTYKQLHTKRTQFASSGSAFSDIAGHVNIEQSIQAAVSQNKDVLKNKETLSKLDELKRKLDDFNKMSVVEKGNFLSSIQGADKLTYVRDLNEKISDLEKQLRDSWGSGNNYNQSSYGNYLNISRNGCGPVALAEMLARRGMYSPSHGMNVGSFMTASAMMGNPLTPGRVTNMTLRHATGNNPITVLGSGPDFGTAVGNNHFMNVIGTDGYGNAYVMNPIDGKIHRRSINDVAGSSLVGLYGSGIGDRIRSGIDTFMANTGDELYDSAKTKVSDFLSRRLEKSSDAVDRSLQKSLDRAKKYGESDKITEEDRAQMNLVMSMMETSAEDGDSAPDKQAIMQEISKIKDQKLKMRLRVAVSGMLDRQSAKKEKGGILGKILSAGKGILKNFFAPLIAGVSSIVTKVIGKAKSFFKPIAEYFKRQLKRNIDKIKAGGATFKQGFGEVREGVGELATGVRNYVGQRTAPIRQAVSMGAQAVGNVVSTGTQAVGSFVGTHVRNAVSTVGHGIANVAGRVGGAVGGAVNTITGGAASAITSKLGGIGKMLSGMGGILSGMAGILFNIFMGVNGFKAIFKTVSTTIKSIAKSFNGLFKSLNKTLKPVLKIVSTTLTTIVKNITSIISPVLEGIAPILTTIGSVVNDAIAPLTPIISFIGKAVGKLVSFILKPVQLVADGINWISKKFAKGMGKLLHPFDKEKRRQYYKDLGLTDDGETQESAAKKKTKDNEYRNLSSEEKDRIAEKYSKLIHPVNKTKRQELYEKMMSGEVTEEDAKAMMRKKIVASAAIVSTGATGIAAYVGTKAAGQIKSVIHDKLTSGSKDEVANRLSKLIYPLDKTKRSDIYDKIMSGQLSVDEAEKMYKRKMLDRAASVVSLGIGGIPGLLAKEGISKTGQALIKFLKDRHDKVDEDNKKLEEKRDKQYEDEQKLQKSIFKNGPLKMLSGINSITDAVSFIKGSGTALFGMAEGGLGNVIGGLGRVITVIGELASYLPFVDENNKIAKLGESLLETSDKMTADATTQLTKGLNMMRAVSTDYIDSNAASTVKTNNASVASEAGSGSKNGGGNNGVISRGNYQSYYSGGDIPYSNADISVIGSGDQSSYGNYLNMAKRGCGPIALADVYNRRTGSNMNARSLASNMINSGTYNPSSGTSVGGFIDAASSLGMGTRVGGVTMRSLKRATPNNPVTLIGSGSEFGTRKGNNHYLNAIGTDSYGGVYVSNPMTGRIQRRSANSLAGASVLGIYGNGDLSDVITFSDETKEKMADLLSLNGIFGKLFNTDSSDVDEMSEEQSKRDNESKIASTARENYSEEDYQTKVLTAMDLYRAENPMKDGETPEEYEKRVTDKWNNDKNIRNKYIAMAVSGNITEDVQKQYDSFILNSKSYYEPYVEYQRDAAGNIVHDESGNPIITGGFKYVLENENSDYVKAKKASLAIKKLGEAIQAATAAGGGSSSSGASGGSGISGNGVNSLYEAASLVFEAAVKNNGGVYATCTDVGPVTLRNGMKMTHFRQDCSGLMSAAVRAMGYDFAKGNATGITTYDMENLNGQTLVVDESGNYSSDWDLIPYTSGALRPGDIVTSHGHMSMYVSGPDTSSWGNRGFDGGSGLGSESPGQGIQTSGAAGTAYLNGDASWQDKLWFTHAGVDGLKRILRYKGASSGGTSIGGVSYGASGSQQGTIKLSKAMQNASNEWQHYPNKLTKGGYWDAAKKAGYTTAQTAMVAAIGIHENGAKKLTGEESVTKVAWDDIGKQYAFGIMNWIPDAKNSRVGADETKYGKTMEDQLNFIRQAYLKDGATEERARIVNFNRYYGSAMKEALGYTPKLGQGDYWGPYAETDIAEAMGHFVGNALVPWDFNRTSGQARHMRTAVEAYNWMLENGMANGYSGSSGSGASTISGGFDISGLLGDYANALPDYYKNMLSTVQSSIDASAAASNASSYYDNYSYDYSYDDEGELGDAEVIEGDTRTYATMTERNDLYNTMHKKHNSTILWSNTQLTSKGYGDVYLYMEPSTSSKITCKLNNNAKYAKVTSSGSWYFVYANYNTATGAQCGWGRMSDFSLTADVKNKTYQTNTVNSANSASDAMYNKWKGSSDSLKFYKYTGDKDAAGGTWNSNYKEHWFTARGPYTGKYREKKMVTSSRAATAGYVDAPYLTFNKSYDQLINNVNRDVLASKVQTKTLAELRKTIGACGDYDFNSPDSYVVPGGLFGSGDDIPPLSNNAFDLLSEYGYNNEGSYTVNNYAIQGGINNETADLSRAELLNYLVGTEFTTRSPRTEKILNKILDKLNNLTTNNTTTNEKNNLYEDEIPEVITSLVRG